MLTGGTADWKAECLLEDQRGLVSGLLTGGEELLVRLQELIHCCQFCKEMLSAFKECAPFYKCNIMQQSAS